MNLSYDSPLVTDFNELPHRLRLIDSRTSLNEVVDRNTAITMARETGLDLVFVNRQEGQPPVYRLVDYNKFVFDQKKADKEKKRIQKQNERTPKEMQFRQQIGDNDYRHKLNQVLEWLPSHDVWVAFKLDRTTRPGIPRGMPFNQLLRWNEFILNKVVTDLTGKAQIGRTIVGERIIKINVKPL